MLWPLFIPSNLPHHSPTQLAANRPSPTQFTAAHMHQNKDPTLMMFERGANCQKSLT